ncbi:MAG: glycosyltransferase family 39 protein [Candidatus Promineifilaceae bacterium]
MNRKYLPTTLLLILFLIFWAVSLRHLTAVPPVYEDEPWQASTGWKLATDGVFGSDLFAGYYGMEHHYYGYLPVHPFLLAAVFKLAGLGLFQARFEPVALGLLVLALTYGVGKRLFRPSVGLLAVFLLLFTRTSALTPSQYTGIVLVDFARIARYDIAVPAFALFAFLLYTFYEKKPHAKTPGRQDQKNESPITNHQSLFTFYFLLFTPYALIGLFTALASLSHLYGLFWFVAFFLLLLWHRVQRRQLAAFVVGFSLPWIIYLMYVLPGWPDWVGQTQDYAPRFALLNPGWYWQNIRNEVQRYGAGLGVGSWFRPGFWTAAVVVPLSLIALGRQALRGNKAAQTLVVPGVLLPLLFALFIYLKLTNYMATLAPLFALVMAWGMMKLWKAGADASRHWYRWRIGCFSLTQLLVICLLLLIGVEGVSRFIHLERAAATTTPYADYSAAIQSHIPQDGRILALHNYWFNFEDWDYRSWFVPILQSNPDYWHPPLSLEAALDGVDPTIILIDRRMRQLFEADPETAEAVFDWMTANGFEQTAAVEDATYGRMDIYLRTDEQQ